MYAISALSIFFAWVTCLCSLRPYLGTTSSRKPHLIHFMPQIRCLCSHNVTEANMDPLTQCIAKYIYRYQAVVKESTAFVARHSMWGQAKITGSSCSKDPNAPVVFREGFLKGDRGVCDQFMWSFWLTGGEVMVVFGSQHHQPSVSYSSGFHMLVVST